MNQGSRGKWSEKVLRKELIAYSGWSTFQFARWPDARAGSAQVALADYIVLYQGKLRLLEVKEVDHDYRLPYKNFDEAQVARMRTWQMAGAEPICLICHRPGAKTAKWRNVRLETFLNRNEATPSGSWDLTNEPLYTLAGAMLANFGDRP